MSAWWPALRNPGWPAVHLTTLEAPTRKARCLERCHRPLPQLGRLVARWWAVARSWRLLAPRTPPSTARDCPGATSIVRPSRNLPEDQGPQLTLEVSSGVVEAPSRMPPNAPALLRNPPRAVCRVVCRTWPALPLRETISRHHRHQGNPSKAARPYPFTAAYSAASAFRSGSSGGPCRCPLTHPVPLNLIDGHPGQLRQGHALGSSVFLELLPLLLRPNENRIRLPISPPQKSEAGHNADSPETGCRGRGGGTSRCAPALR